MARYPNGSLTANHGGIHYQSQDSRLVGGGVILKQGCERISISCLANDDSIRACCVIVTDGRVRWSLAKGRAGESCNCSEESRSTHCYS